MRTLLLGIAISIAACLARGTFTCRNDGQCVQEGVEGMCVKDGDDVTGACAYPDSECPGTMARYGDSAGDDLEGQCVQDGSGSSDGSDGGGTAAAATGMAGNS